MLKHFDLKKAGRVYLWIVSVAAFLAIPALATAETVDWSTSFALREMTLQNPKVLAYLNPQPEPPGEAVLDLTATANPVITAERDGKVDFRILFALSGAVPLHFQRIIEPEESHLEFKALDESEQVVYQVIMDIFTSSGGIPGSWVRINPQPEPPLPAGAAYTGFDFIFTSYSTASLSFQVLDQGGQPLNFTLAPLPGALLLLGSGLLGLMAYGRLWQ